MQYNNGPDASRFNSDANAAASAVEDCASGKTNKLQNVGHAPKIITTDEQERQVSKDLCKEIAILVETTIEKKFDSDYRRSKQLVYLLRLLPHITETGDSALAFNAQLAARVLMSKRPDFILSDGVLKSIAIRAKVEKFEPAVWVLLGLTASTVFWFFCGITFIYLNIFILNFSEIYVDNIKVSFSLIAISVFSGGLGSVVSAAINFSKTDIFSYNNSVLFLTGFLRPIIGMSSALFALSIIKSGFGMFGIASGTISEPAIWIIFSFCFIAGFVERFAVVASGKMLKTHWAEKNDSRNG